MQARTGAGRVRAMIGWCCSPRCCRCGYRPRAANWLPLRSSIVQAEHFGDSTGPLQDI